MSRDYFAAYADDGIYGVGLSATEALMSAHMLGPKDPFKDSGYFKTALISENLYHEVMTSGWDFRRSFDVIDGVIIANGAM